MLSQPLKLIICIALGIWLGFMAVAATGVVAYNALLADQVNAVSSAVSQLKAPHAPQQAESDNPMFEKYKQNVLDTQTQQNEELTQAEREKRLSGPKCQFWMQQDQTAPSAKSRANVVQFCG